MIKKITLNQPGQNIVTIKHEFGGIWIKQGFGDSKEIVFISDRYLSDIKEFISNILNHEIT